MKRTALVHLCLWFGEGFPGGNNSARFPLLGGARASADFAATRTHVRYLCRITNAPSGGNLVLLIQAQRPWDLSDANLGGFLYHVLRFFPRARWCPFLDPKLREEQWPDGSLRELADHLRCYDAHPQRWRIEGRPVTYIWAMHHPRWDLAGVEAGGFIVGDVFGAQGQPVVNIAGGFVSKLPGPSYTRPLTDVVGRELSREWERWRSAGYRVIPAVSLYDDTEFNPDSPTVITTEPGEFAWAIRTAFDHASVIDGEQYALIGTTRNGLEGTHLVPDSVRGRSTGREVKEALRG